MRTRSEGRHCLPTLRDVVHCKFTIVITIVHERLIWESRRQSHEGEAAVRRLERLRDERIQFCFKKEGEVERADESSGAHV
jgi:hypothetical protein